MSLVMHQDSFLSLFLHCLVIKLCHLLGWQRLSLISAVNFAIASMAFAGHMSRG